MQVILLENVENLGGIGDLVKVKPGYGRNYLLPQGKVALATPKNIKEIEVRRVEPFREQSASGGSYMAGTPDGSRPGVFYANAYDLSARPSWAMESLYLHEAIPGHHFQISLQIENEEANHSHCQDRRDPSRPTGRPARAEPDLPGRMPALPQGAADTAGMDWPASRPTTSWPGRNGARCSSRRGGCGSRTSPSTKPGEMMTNSR